MKLALERLKRILLATVVAALVFAALCDIAFLVFGRQLTLFATDAF